MLFLKKLSVSDSKSVYTMLQGIERNDNGFHNDVSTAKCRDIFVSNGRATPIESSRVFIFSALKTRRVAEGCRDNEENNLLFYWNRK